MLSNKIIPNQCCLFVLTELLCGVNSQLFSSAEYLARAAAYFGCKPPQTVDAGAACANKRVIWFCSLGAFGTAGAGHPSTESFSQLRCV